MSTMCRRFACSRFAKVDGLCLHHVRVEMDQYRGASACLKLPVSSTFNSRLNGRCKYYGCSSYARKGGLCSRHGGGQKCSVENCSTPSQTNGLCRVHGGGTRCKAISCAKFARTRGYCSSHSRLSRTQHEVMLTERTQ